MRLIRIFACLAALAALSVTAAPSTAATVKHGTLIDPAFKLRYDPAVVHYEPMPSRIREICKDFNPAWAFWLYAHVRQGSADFYIINALPDDSFGLVVRIEGQECGQADFGNTYTAHVPPGGYASVAATSPMPGFEPNVPNEGEIAGNYHYVLRFASEEAVLRGLIRDATARGEKAWGASAFRKKICPYDGKNIEKHVPLLVDEFRRYCSRQ